MYNIDKKKLKVKLVDFSNYQTKFPEFLAFFFRGSEFSSYEIELQNRVTQNDVTLQVTNSKMFTEILL